MIRRRGPTATMQRQLLELVSKLPYQTTADSMQHGYSRDVSAVGWATLDNRLRRIWIVLGRGKERTVESSRFHDDIFQAACGRHSTCVFDCDVQRVQNCTTAHMSAASCTLPEVPICSDEQHPTMRRRYASLDPCRLRPPRELILVLQREGSCMSVTVRIPNAHAANLDGVTIFAVDTLHRAAACQLPNVSTAGTALRCSLETGCSDGDA
ncbi:hypothetical protein Q7P35_009783 [Cladosporium inversicolor]